MDLSHTNSEIDGRTVLTVAGEIDLATAPALRTRLIEIVAGGCHSLVIDLSRVGFVDSTGLGVLIGARRRIRGAGGELTLVIPQDQIRELVAAAGLDGIFTIVDGLPAAGY